MTLTFSEPVFKLENITTRTIGRRMLVKPFLDVQVIAGEYSDPELLGFETKINWPNNSTIQVELAFKTPPALSATKPAD